MAHLRDIVAYILGNYPYEDELSNARVTKMVYLADWKSALDYGKTITDIHWYFDNHGPFVWDIKNEVQSDSDIFAIHSTTNMFGGKKDVLVLVDDEFEPNLTNKEVKCLDHVIEQTKPLTWAKFITLVYSTYPVASSERYSALDLVRKAREYKRTSGAAG